MGLSYFSAAVALVDGGGQRSSCAGVGLTALGTCQRMLSVTVTPCRGDSEGHLTRNSRRALDGLLMDGASGRPTT
jgi:hypothetical protein